MANPRSDGRMIRKDISESDKFAGLSAEAAVLFAMLIPHYSPFGKLNGGPGYIKEIICPKIPYLTIENLPYLLSEITEKTNVKWFENDKRYWIHSLSFLREHQKIDTKKLGKDLLPNYSETSPGVVHDYSEVSPELVHHEPEPEPERECEREGESGTSLPFGFKPDQINSDTPLPPLAQAAWDRLQDVYPKSNGIIKGRDAAVKAFIRGPAEWNRWIRNAGHYAASDDAKNGFVMNLDRWLSGPYRDYDAPVEPLGDEHPPPDTSWDERRAADLKIALEEKAQGKRPERKVPWKS